MMIDSGPILRNDSPLAASTVLDLNKCSGRPVGARVVWGGVSQAVGLG